MPCIIRNISIPPWCSCDIFKLLLVVCRFNYFNLCPSQFATWTFSSIFLFLLISSHTKTEEEEEITPSRNHFQSILFCCFYFWLSFRFQFHGTHKNDSLRAYLNLLCIAFHMILCCKINRCVCKWASECVKDEIKISVSWKYRAKIRAQSSEERHILKCI
jgi:hypothetical protein